MESRTHLARVTAELTGERLLGPYLTIVNPPLWELGHVAWFQEYWCLRRKADGSAGDSVMHGADALYDSARVAHERRWSLPLPGLTETQAYQAQILARVVERLGREPDNRMLRYFVRLATFHEDMHAEAFRYTCQTLGYPDPLRGERTQGRSAQAIQGDVELPGGRFELGAPRDGAFVFDNEKWAHEVVVQPLRISRAAVTNREFLEFVESGAYAQRALWSEDGWSWLSQETVSGPAYWVRRDGTWLQRRFDRLVPLAPEEPVLHVNWHEAQAYCAFAQRRLPSEAEWEYAAAWDANGEKRRYPWGSASPDAAKANLESVSLVAVGAHADGDAASGCRQMIGNTWEWTSSAFEPYPGFEIDPYKEYSAPWFGTHKVLRGASFASSRRLPRNTFRNFYLPERSDIFAGFRTCAR
jgi:iron(II)-dependent oxidoreductase